MSEEERIPDIKSALPFYVEPTQEQRAVWEAEKLADLQAQETRWKITHERFLFVGGDHHTYLGDADYSVSYYVDEEGTYLHIEGDTNGVDMEDMVSLTPKHALALLAWLEEQKATLEELAKEQG